MCQWLPMLCGSHPAYKSGGPPVPCTPQQLEEARRQNEQAAAAAAAAPSSAQPPAFRPAVAIAAMQHRTVQPPATPHPHVASAGRLTAAAYGCEASPVQHTRGHRQHQQQQEQEQPAHNLLSWQPAPEGDGVGWCAAAAELDATLVRRHADAQLVCEQHLSGGRRHHANGAAARAAPPPPAAAAGRKGRSSRAAAAATASKACSRATAAGKQRTASAAAAAGGGGAGADDADDAGSRQPAEGDVEPLQHPAVRRRKQQAR